jgi:two-component system, OmpR family, sensor kinase
MTIRRRLTIVVTASLAVTMAAFAWLLVRSTRAELRNQLAQAVVGAAAKDGPFRGASAGLGSAGLGSAGLGSAGSQPRPRNSNGSGGTNRTDTRNSLPPNYQNDPGVSGGRRVARFLFAPTGELLNFEPSGFASSPDPTVNLPPIGSAEQRHMVDRLVVRPSEDGSIRYLVMTRNVLNQRVRFDAISMESADRAVRRLELFAGIGGTLATMAASVLTTLMIRRTLRPVDEMVTTSERIAAGDLTARSPENDRATEIGRLGLALNRMLETVETAIGERDEKETELRRFIADTSHELRTPITVVQGYSDLYRSGALADKAQLDKAMDRIENQAERMSRLVQDLLLLANLERPDFIRRERVDLTSLAKESLSEFAMLSPEYPTTLNAGPNVYLDGDSQRIRQVFDNLLRNISEHTSAGTNVCITISATNDLATVNVHNDGPAIDPEDCKHLFKRFWKGSPAKGTTGRTSGLGLAITESIVTAHGGTISVCSNQDSGTTFLIELPTSVAQSHKTPTETNS